MAKGLVIKANTFIEEKEIEEIRQDVIRQFNDGGVIVVPKHYDIIEVEFDHVRAEEGVSRYE